MKCRQWKILLFKNTDFIWMSCPFGSISVVLFRLNQGLYIIYCVHNVKVCRNPNIPSVSGCCFRFSSQQTLIAGFTLRETCSEQLPTTAPLNSFCLDLCNSKAFALILEDCCSENTAGIWQWWSINTIIFFLSLKYCVA